MLSSSSVAGARAASGGRLLHRHGLAGHGRLRHEQVLGREYAAVGRDHVAGRQHDQVAGHQQPDRQLHAAHAGVFGQAAAQHRRRVADHGLERVGCLAGPALLPEAQQGGQHHHGPYHQGALHVAGEERDGGQQRQQQAERGAKAVPQVHPPGQRLLVLHLVGARALAHGVGLRLGQAGLGAAELPQQGPGIGVRRRGQRPGLRRGQFPADAGAAQGLQQGPAAEVPDHAARAQETGEDLSRDVGVHGGS